jgi:hypothetical protein
MAEVLRHKEKNAVLSVLGRLLPSDNGLVEFGRDVEARGVGLINAAPLGMGLFTQPGPQAWHPAAQGLKGT